MTPFEYIRERMARIHPESEKLQNTGALTLVLNNPTDELLTRLIQTSWETLLQFCLRSKHTRPLTVKLTFISYLMGKWAAEELGEPIQTPKISLCLGDFFLESFLQCGLITIEREYVGRRAPYIVRLLNMEIPDGRPLLVSTVFDAPDPIRSFKSEISQKPFLKDGSPELFNQDVYDQKPYIQALDKIRSQGFRLNLPVLAQLRLHPPPHSLELIDMEGEIHTIDIKEPKKHLPNKLLHIDGTEFRGKTKDPRWLRILSKWYEYQQTLRKAVLIAEEENGDIFWQEVSCDYRGREYIVEPFLNYQSADMARALFLFDEGKPLTPEGYFCLLVHSANCLNATLSKKDLTETRGWMRENYLALLKKERLDALSLDKLSLEDRAEWMQRMFPKFLTKGGQAKFHPEAEKPFSFFATLLELCRYRDDPEGHRSHLPIPIDGAQNGWQHLAAISKDREAGALVSLIDSPIPHDFYIRVAKEMIKLMPEWFAEKKIPMKHIRKGIAKRGSMTRAYSAGLRRIAINMYDDCHAEGYTQMYDITEEDTVELASKLIEGVNRVCVGPLKTMKFFQKIAAKQLQKEGAKPYLTWITPSGFRVRYEANYQREYEQRGTIRGLPGSTTNRIKHTLRIDVTSKSGEKIPDIRAFMSGISPNLIHSMDAAHMHLIAQEMAHEGLAFAGIHDSFATHASDVPKLKQIARQKFIEIYNKPNMFKQIRELLMDDPIDGKADEPPLGDLDITEVRSSRHAFA